MKKNTNDNNKEKLSSKLRARIEKLLEEAVRTDGKLSSADIEELNNLARLLELSESTKPMAKRSRWPIIVMLLVTLAIISVLFFARLPSAQINLNLSLSELYFRLSQQQVFTEMARMSTLGVSGLTEVQYPRTQKVEGQVFNSNDESTFAIKLSAETNKASEGTLTLAPLILHSKAGVWLQAVSENSAECNLSILDSQLVLQADVNGQVGVGLSSFPFTSMNLTSPKSFILHAGTNEVNLNINPLPGHKTIFKYQIIIDSLSVFHVEEYADEQQTLTRQISSIISGSLYYESLGGSERNLHANEKIQFRELKGYISELELKDGEVNLTFNGIVSGMSTGTDENRISLMPTYLEWLRAKHSLSLLWGTSIYFFGLLLGITRWWKSFQ